MRPVRRPSVARGRTGGHARDRWAIIRVTVRVRRDYRPRNARAWWCRRASCASALSCTTCRTPTTRRTVQRLARAPLIRAALRCYHSTFRPQRVATGENMRNFLANLGIMVHRPLSAGALLAAVALAACTTAQYPPAPLQVASNADYVYHIGPTDTVNIIVWRNPELSMVVPVRPDGHITMPLVDDLPALGKTPSELERDMEKALG